MRDRTADLLRAKQALSQLSYGPSNRESLAIKAKTCKAHQQYVSKSSTQTNKNLVGLGRLELPTSPLSGVRSNQLSYRPKTFTASYRIGLQVRS